MAKDQRFEIVYSQGTITVTEIWVDKETGVNYLYHASGYSGGLTPLLDREGKPVISPIMNSSRSRSHDRNLKTGPCCIISWKTGYDTAWTGFQIPVS